MGGCQNYGPFLGPGACYLGYPRRDHNFDNHPYDLSTWNLGVAENYMSAQSGTIATHLVSVWPQSVARLG